MTSRLFVLMHPRVEVEDQRHPRHRVWLREGSPVFLPDGAEACVEFDVEGSQYKAVVTVVDGDHWDALPVLRDGVVDIETHGVRMIARATEFSPYGYPMQMLVDVLDVTRCEVRSAG